METVKIDMHLKDIHDRGLMYQVSEKGRGEECVPFTKAGETLGNNLV